jgi:hypothetical protein
VRGPSSIIRREARDFGGPKRPRTRASRICRRPSSSSTSRQRSASSSPRPGPSRAQPPRAGARWPRTRDQPDPRPPARPGGRRRASGRSPPPTARSSRAARRAGRRPPRAVLAYADDDIGLAQGRVHSGPRHAAKRGYKGQNSLELTERPTVPLRPLVSTSSLNVSMARPRDPGRVYAPHRPGTYTTTQVECRACQSRRLRLRSRST